MPGCVLRVIASEFPLPNGLLTTRTRNGGFLCSVSDADGNAFKTQVLDAQSFLSEHAAALSVAAKSPGFNAELDFGVWTVAPDAMSKSFSFPQSLLILAATCGVALTVSVYHAADS